MKVLNPAYFEFDQYYHYSILKVVGGWVISITDTRKEHEATGVSFVSDPEHKNKPVPID